MQPQSSVWLSTLEDFDRQITKGDAVTGAVAVAAVSAACAVSVLRMVLEISSRKKDSEGHAERLRQLLDAAKIEAGHLRQAADDDRAAYAAYLEASRLPRGSESERAERHRAMQTALAHATEVPLGAVRSAVQAMELCAEAAEFVRGEVAADVGGAAALLNGAVQAILNSVDANLLRMDDGKFASQKRDLEERTGHFAELVRVRLRTTAQTEKGGRPLL